MDNKRLTFPAPNRDWYSTDSGMFASREWTLIRRAEYISAGGWFRTPPPRELKIVAEIKLPLSVSAWVAQLSNEDRVELLTQLEAGHYEDDL